MNPQISSPSADADAASHPVLDERDEGDLLLRVNGIVPATDFHSFVVAVARKHGLRGWVRHEAPGALVRAVGSELALVRLVRAIRDEAPASARVRSLDTEPITAETPAAGDRFVALVDEVANVAA